MKKLAGYLAAALILAGAQVLRRQQDNPLVSPAERQTLRDALNDDLSGQLPQLPKLKLAGAPKEEVSLLYQFCDKCTRSQCGIGDCHDFGAVAALEAAYYRKYQATIRFSEADIFIRRTVLSGDVYADFRHGGTCKMHEAAKASEDIQFAMDHGVATSIQYKQFAKRYLSWRAAKQDTMELINENYSEQPWLERFFNNPRKNWAGAQTQPENQRLTEMLLAGGDPILDEERAGSKDKLTGFVKKSRDFSGYCPYGQSQGEAILAELKAGRPVTVTMDAKGLKAWGAEPGQESAEHVFAIIGYRRQPDGKVVFQTRNSQGANNPDLHEDELCRIVNIVSVLTPEEAAAR